MIRALGVLPVLLALAATPAAGQLRPLPEVDWELFEDGGGSVLLRTGVGVHSGQRASLAGTEGRLLEVGNFSGVLRSGRFALELGGTLVRLFEDRATFAEPAGGARPEQGPDRRDSGAYQVGTVVRLTPAGSPALALLRFGTRLPTTDNEVGLDRDRTDFYALVGGGVRRGPLRLGAEAGLGINGTHDLRYEQNDVLLYSLSSEFRHRLLSPQLALVGQRGGFDGYSARGTENLAELRVGARTGGRLAARVQWVRGLTEFSPHSGVLLSVEARR